MKQSELSVSCRRVRSRIDLYLDGDLSPVERAAVEAHLVHCSDCTRETELARRIVVTLHSFPPLECPDRVIDRVREYVQSTARNGRGPLLPHRITRWVHGAWQPLAVGVAAALLVAITGLLGNHPAPPPRFSAENLARAEVEAKWTFAYLGSVGRKTEAMVWDGIFEQRIAAPIIRAVGQSFNRHQKHQPKEVRNAG